MKQEVCHFSGLKVYPGHGSRFVRGDSKTFIFLNSKSSSCFHKHFNPRKMAWTTFYRRLHKKGQVEEVHKRRARKTQKFQRAIVGASLEVIRAKRNQKPEVRQAAREAALREIKERKAAKKVSSGAQGIKHKVAKPMPSSRPNLKGR